MLNYILNNAKDLSIREFIIIIIFYLTLVANYNNNKLLKNNNHKIIYSLSSAFITLMLILYLMNFQIAFIMLAIILILFIIWMIYNLKMMKLFVV